MMDRKNQGDQGTPRGESRRDFLKKAGVVMAAGPAAYLARVLEVKAAVEQDGALVNAAIQMVEANARKGMTGKGLLLAAAYQAKGGRNSEVLNVLQLVDERLKDANAFKEFNQAIINKAVADGIIDFVGPRTGPVADKGSRLYNVRESAARVMFDRGGAQLKGLMTQKGHMIPGYNAPAGAMTPKPGMMQPKLPGGAPPVRQ